MKMPLKLFSALLLTISFNCAAAMGQNAPTTAPAAATQPAGRSSSIQCIESLASDEARCLKYPDITGLLSARLKVRDQADTIDELIARVKPTFSWRNDLKKVSPEHGLVNFLWIEKSDAGEPVFRLEMPFTWQPDGQKARWVLLDELHLECDARYREQTSCRFMPARVEVTEKRPVSDSFLPYAILKSVHTQGGKIYEIGWTSWSYGTNLREEQRLFYLWMDAKKNWRLIGEGPYESQGHLGGGTCGGGESVEIEIEWKGQPIQPVVKFIQTTSCSEVGEELTGLPLLYSRRDAILELSDGKTPGKLRWLNDRPYWLAKEGDTLEKIAHDHAAWAATGYYGKDAAEKSQRQEKVRNAWYKSLVFLNPEISKKGVSAGDRINLPISTEIGAALKSATQPAGR